MCTFCKHVSFACVFSIHTVIHAQKNLLFLT
uniref:Uncharacterized protein n=1 Tax=Arundo donax TaxID=35708 RepID=A0A0A9FSH6_ARUDO